MSPDLLSDEGFLMRPEAVFYRLKTISSVFSESRIFSGTSIKTCRVAISNPIPKLHCFDYCPKWIQIGVIPVPCACLRSFSHL
jgi:hypothetical protein